MMFVLHVALQGCLRADGVVFGLTADTGGHIRYLLDLVAASAQDVAVERIVVATRLFLGAPGPEYAVPEERISDKVELLRLASASPGYRAKEDMHAEVASYARNLVAWIAAQPRAPDVIHAHYADAATVAAIVEDRLGIPFVFTAHSLGRVKAAMLGSPAGKCPGLARRIAVEEAALDRAGLIIASSRDEAEVQYAGYPSYDPGRIRIIPPGSDLALFAGTRSDAMVDARIDRFLADPTKPVILAIAELRQHIERLVEQDKFRLGRRRFGDAAGRAGVLGGGSARHRALGAGHENFSG